MNRSNYNSSSYNNSSYNSSSSKRIGKTDNVEVVEIDLSLGREEGREYRYTAIYLSRELVGE